MVTGASSHLGNQIYSGIKEDKSIYSKLENMEMDIDLIKKADLRHEQLEDTLDLLRRGKKQK